MQRLDRLLEIGGVGHDAAVAEHDRAAGVSRYVLIVRHENHRDPLPFVELAKQADRLVGSTNGLVLRTLAAAYAENGDFANAIRTARSAVHLARMHGEDSLMTDLDQQIALYQLGMPYRDRVK